MFGIASAVLYNTHFGNVAQMYGDVHCLGVTPLAG